MLAWLGCFFLTLPLTACQALFFFPEEGPLRMTPDRIDLTYEDVFFESDDRTLLHGWFLPAMTSPTKDMVLFFHGNAENVSTHIGNVHWLPKEGHSVMIFDYRGYGRSSGAPDLAGVHQDGAAALRQALALAPPEGSLWVFGQSLGGSIAAYTVAHAPPDIKKRIHAVVLEGTFSSYRVIAQEKMADLWFAWSFQWLPNLTLSDHYAAKTSVPLITDIPLLLVHGCADTTIPCEHSKRLLTLAGSLGELWLPENVEHTQAFRTPEKQKQLLKWLENTTPSGQKK